jgi:sarcosine oxidase subunit alpha
VLVTCHDDAYRTALSLADAGASVNAVVDMRARADGFLPKQVRARGIDVIAGATVTGTSGRMRVSSVQVASLDGKGDIRELECDLVAMSGGFTPSVHLFSQSRGSLRYDETLGSYRPDAARQPARCAGAANGTLPLRAVLQEGFAAGADAAQSAGFASAGPNAVPETTDPEAHSGGFHLGYGRATAAHRKSFVDFQSDVTIADLRLAHREGYALPEHLKRYTTAGMGVDQGKTGNVNGLAILAELSGGSIAELAATTFRPPYVPLGFGAIAGADRGELFDPVRITPMHAWHERCGAVFEDVGQWKRPWYYPRGGETMRQAVDRECLAVRRDVGMLDASTLGKIDIQGEDALEFLERVYCNGFRSLAIGRCRYGVMLRQDGMVFDDGVTARLGERHFLMTTTTGGAARVLAWLEEWLQTEWPTLKVYCTSVTEQYAQIAVSGPRSADLVSPLTSVKLDAMPFMSVREGEVAGIAARIFRISFSGALGYEIAVPASRAYELWTTLIGAGERFGITPYGTEAMHVLRAEKGFIIAGQDTDGSVTPIDLGMDRMVAMGKDFIGKRSLARADLLRRDRKQLVGLLTDDPDAVLPEGVHVVEEVTPPPMPMLGHVTSSYYSAVLRRSIALALIRGGVARIGGELHAMVDGVAVKVNVVAPRFLNDSNEAING